MSPTFGSLQYHNYRLWFAGAMVSNVGTWMQRVAQDWLVLTVLSHDSGVAVGVITALQFAPILLLSAWAGLLADRVPRRALLFGTQAAQGLLAVGLGILVLGGHVQLWHVAIFATLLGCVSAIDAPVRQIFVAELVPMEKLSNAVGLNSASFHASRMIGPGLAGLLIAAVGTGWVFIINGASFVATIVVLFLMRPQLMHRLPRAPRASGQIREGLRYVRNRSDIIVIFCVVSVVSTFGLNFQLTSAMMARVEFGRGPGEYGLLGSVMAIGSVAGALLAARRERPRVRLVVGAAFGFGIAEGVLALMPNYAWFAVACIPVGFASLTMMTAANTAIQMTTEPTMRGRVMALYMIVFLGATPVGSPIVGWIAEVFGPRWSLGVGAITALLVSAGAALWARRRWDVTVHYHGGLPPRVEVRNPTADRDTGDGFDAAAGVRPAALDGPVEPTPPD